MAVEGGVKCMKYILVVFNALFVIMGAVCLGIGIWILIDKDKLMELAKLDSTDYDVPSLLEKGAYVLLGGGGLMFLIGVLGCIGACKESRCLLIMYGILVLLVFTVELVAAILAAVYQGKIESETKKYLKEMIDKEYLGLWNASHAFSVALDYVQVTYKCCGIDNETDFDSASKWIAIKGSANIPISCCRFDDLSPYPDNPSALVPEPGCPNSPAPTNAWMNKGCYNTIRELLEDNAKIVIGVGVGVAVIELLGVIFAFCLCSKLREQNKIY